MTNNQLQCDFCAFKLTEDQSTAANDRLIETKYRTLRGIKKGPKKTRIIHVGGNDDRTETCFIDSPMWDKRNENIHCPDRLDNSLSLETALDLREARVANRTAREANVTARDAKIWAIVAAIIAAIAIILPYINPPR